MRITFYKNYSADKQAIKTIANSLEFDCVLKREAGVSVRNPVVEIAGDYADFAKYNYAYIEDFDRYYYIVDVNFYRTGYFVLTLKCDVLMSFYSEFAGNQCIASRNENAWNQYFTDNQKPEEAGELFDRFVFTIPEFGGSSLLLLSSGGGFSTKGTQGTGGTE